MHHNLSIAYRRTGQPALARREADRALGLFSAQANRSDLARLQGDYGVLLRQHGQLSDAEHYLRQALATYEKVEDRRNLPYTLITLRKS
jgi:Tfp pilus assembly protein PilF